MKDEGKYGPVPDMVTDGGKEALNHLVACIPRQATAHVNVVSVG
jgi:hypothetical protein